MSGNGNGNKQLGTGGNGIEKDISITSTSVSAISRFCHAVPNIFSAWKPSTKSKTRRLIRGKD